MTGVKIQTPSVGHLHLILGATLVMHFCVQLCPFVTGNTFDKFGNYRLTKRRIVTDSVSVIACCRECSMHSWCRFLSYRPSTKSCQLSDISCNDFATYSTRNGGWISFVTNYTACITLLVSGSNGTGQSQLTASSSCCGHHATDARLNFTGSWSAMDKNTAEYVQADFGQAKSIAAIMMQGRYTNQGIAHPYIQYVTSFRVLTSFDCATFSYVEDKPGINKIFDGNSSPEEIVTRYLREWIIARCIRINPVAWVEWPSLRFDVLGC